MSTWTRLAPVTNAALRTRTRSRRPSPSALLFLQRASSTSSNSGRRSLPAVSPSYIGSAFADDSTHDPRSRGPPPRRDSTFSLSPARGLKVGPLGQLQHVKLNHHTLLLQFEHFEYSLSRQWLRDGCLCSHCVSDSSGQKKFATCDISDVPEIESHRILPDGSLELVWARDFLQGQNHTSIYYPEFLQSSLQRQRSAEYSAPHRVPWNRATFEQDMGARAISYSDWMEGGQRFATGLVDLQQWGLVLVKGVPTTKDAVKDVANKVGALQNTFYGETWDVVSKPNAENVAYTNEFLCLHQDLMYWNDSPRIQLLHCMENDCEGGDSLFSDGFRAGAQLLLQSPREYSLLGKMRIPFQYARNGNFYRSSRPVIHADERPFSTHADLPRAISWSPPFQGRLPPWFKPSLAAWCTAARKFRDTLEAPENMLQFRLQPGDCVLFDNHRILHGRTKFDTASGQRHLHGAYLDTQTMLSAHQRMEHQGYIVQDASPSWEKEWKLVTELYGRQGGKAIPGGFRRQLAGSSTLESLRQDGTAAPEAEAPATDVPGSAEAQSDVAVSPPTSS